MLDTPVPIPTLKLGRIGLRIWDKVELLVLMAWVQFIEVLISMLL